MIKISEDALGMVKKMISENTDPENCPTLSSAGAGCGAPAIKLELRRGLDDDIISDIGGLPFHIRASVQRYLDNAEITVEQTFWGSRLKVSTGYGCR